MSPDPFVTLRLATPSFGRRALWPELVGHGIIVARRAAQHFRSVWRGQGRCSVRETKLGKEDITSDIPATSERSRRHLDRRGIARVGSVLHHGDLLVGKVSPMAKSELTIEDKILHVVFGRAGEEVHNDSLVYRHRDPGRVSQVHFQAIMTGICPDCGEVDGRWTQVCPHCGEPLTSRQRVAMEEDAFVVVEVGWEVERGLCVGDVLETESGQRLTVVGIRPDEEVPADALTLNSRGPLRLRKVTQRVEDKLQARGLGPRSPLTRQPTTDPLASPGQVLDRETMFALVRAGLTTNLAELLTFKCDHAPSRRGLRRTLRSGRNRIRLEGDPDTLPLAANRLLRLCEAAGFNLAVEGSLSVGFASPEQIVQRSHGQVTKAYTLNERTWRPEQGGVDCERIFGPVKGMECACGKFRGRRYRDIVCDRCGTKVTWSEARFERAGHIELARPVVHPWLLRKASPLAGWLGLSHEALLSLARCETFAVPGCLIDWHEYQRAVAKDDTFHAETGAAGVAVLLSERNHPAGMILSQLPVLPAWLRRDRYDEERQQVFASTLSKRYARVVEVNNRLRYYLDQGVPAVLAAQTQRELQNAVTTLFGNPWKRLEAESDLDPPQRDLATDLGWALRGLFQRTVDFSAWGVVVPDPVQTVGTLGVPARAIRTLFRPIVAAMLIREKHASTPRQARRLLRRCSAQAEELLARALAERPLLVVAPGGPLIILRAAEAEGEALRVHPDDGRRLGLAYAGEGLTLHVPLTTAAVAELKAPAPPAAPASTLADLTPLGLVGAALAGRTLDLSLLAPLVSWNARRHPAWPGWQGVVKQKGQGTPQGDVHAGHAKRGVCRPLQDSE